MGVDVEAKLAWGAILWLGGWYVAVVVGRGGVVDCPKRKRLIFWAGIVLQNGLDKKDGGCNVGSWCCGVLARSCCAVPSTSSVPLWSLGVGHGVMPSSFLVFSLRARKNCRLAELAMGCLAALA